MNVATSRVMIHFSVGEGGDRIIETMHAIRIDDGRYVLGNTPFYAYGVSFGDTVAATMQDGALVHSHVVARGGHSTYRIKLPVGRDHEDFLRHWSALEELGCSYEGSSAKPQRLYAIDVPPGVDVPAVYRLLEQVEVDGLWEFEEVHYFDPNSD